MMLDFRNTHIRLGSLLAMAYKKDSNVESSIKFIGCCGAYCKTYPPFIERYFKGCKIGYDTGERDINKAKCKMKVSCLKERKLETCAYCSNYHGCNIIHGFYSKNGYKYKKYKQSIRVYSKERIPKIY